jgi:hypothetical protein
MQPEHSHSPNMNLSHCTQAFFVAVVVVVVVVVVVGCGGGVFTAVWFTWCVPVNPRSKFFFRKSVF